MNYEKTIQKYIGRCQREKIPIALCNIKIQHKREGKIIYEESRHSRSWVRNKFNLDSSFWGVNGSDAVAFQDGQINLRDTGGTLRSANFFICCDVTALPIAMYSGPVGNANLGIVIGTGVAAESPNNHALNAKINHGVGAGQMSYGASALLSGPTYTPATKIWNVVYSRDYSNIGGGNITVTESGIYSTLYLGASYVCMTCRDLFSVPIATIIGDMLTVQYQPYITFP